MSIVYMYKYMYHVKHGVLIFTCQTIFSGRWRPQCHQCVLDPFVNKSARCMRLSLTYFQLIRSRSVSYLYFNDVTILILLGGFFVGKKSYVTTNSERSKIKAIKESVYTNYKNILAPCKIVNCKFEHQQWSLLLVCRVCLFYVTGTVYENQQLF